MGNSKSKSYKHEKLEEEDDVRYFAKVQERNKVTTHDFSIPRDAQQSVFGRKKKKKKKKSQSQLPGSDNLINSSNTSTNIAKEVVPKIPIQSLPLSPLTSNKSVVSESSPSLLKPPREANTHHSHGKTNKHKKTSQNVIPRVEQQEIEESLSTGKSLISAEITRGGRVTCVSWLNDDHGTSSPLAIGTDDGIVAIIEYIYSSQQHQPIEQKLIREIPREGKVRSIAWSPEGDLLVIAGDDSIAAVIDISTFEILVEIEREDRIYSVEFSPNGEFLAIAGFDGLVTIVNTESFEILTEISRQGLILSLCWSPDSSLLATCGSDKMLSVIDIDGWEVVGEIPRPSSLLCVSWSPSGSLLLCGGQDGVLSVFDVDKLEIINEISTNNCRINSLCWNGTGEFFCVGASNNRALIYESTSFTLIHDISRVAPVTATHWQSRGYLAIGSDDSKVAIVKTGDDILNKPSNNNTAVSAKELKDDRADIDDEINGYNAVGANQFTNDNHKDMATKNNQQQAESEFSVWNMGQTSFEEDHQLSKINTSAPEPAAVLVAPAKEEGNNELNNPNPDTGYRGYGDVPLQYSITATFSNDRTTLSVAEFSGDSFFLACGGSDGKVVIYSTETWDVVTDIVFSQAVKSIIWSSDGDYMVVSLDDNCAYIAEIQEQMEISNELSLSAPATALAWSVADERLALGLADGTLAVVDTSSAPSRSWTISSEVEISDKAITSVDWSTNGKYLAVGSEDNLCSIFSADDVFKNQYELLAEIERTGPIRTVSFGVGGTLLAIGGDDSTLGVYVANNDWDLHKEIKMIDPINIVRWSLDGRFLAIGGNDKRSSCSIYDTVVWKRIEIMEENVKLPPVRPVQGGYNVSVLDWSGDEEWLVFGGKYGCVYLVDTKNFKLTRILDRPEDDDEGGIQVDEDNVNEDDVEEDPESNAVHEMSHEQYDNSSDGNGEAFDENDDGGNDNIEEELDEEAEELEEVDPAEEVLTDANSILLDLENAEQTTPAVTKKIKNKKTSVMRRWTQRSEPRTFIEVCDAFLENYEYDDPPQELRVFVAAILMLQWHTQWLNSHEMIVDVLSMQDEGAPLDLYCHVLDQSSNLMTKVLESEEEGYSWWSGTKKFNLTNGDIRKFKVWNSWWEQVDESVPPVDSNLLYRVDKEQ